jgi:hypothetical protein|tara:strand:- start:744 stop:1064 length:321 start_codon:yes stop_codon:yes gene_type:complete
MKYKNKITEVDGIKFHSKKEADRYLELRILEKAKKIKDLELQPKIPLLVNGKKIGNYIGDFKYFDIDKLEFILEDVKSPITKTSTYKLKKKILETYNPPIEIIEIF